jgi:hypothetical protein
MEAWIRTGKEVKTIFILPHADKAIVSIEKLTDYVLHPIHSKGKFAAFESAYVKKRRV